MDRITALFQILIGISGGALLSFLTLFIILIVPKIKLNRALRKVGR